MGQDERRRRGKAKCDSDIIEWILDFKTPKSGPRERTGTQMRPGFFPVGSPVLSFEELKLLLHAGGPQNETKILSNILTGLNFKYDGEAMKWACSN